MLIEHSLLLARYCAWLRVYFDISLVCKKGCGLSGLAWAGDVSSIQQHLADSSDFTDSHTMTSWNAIQRASASHQVERSRWLIVIKLSWHFPTIRYYEFASLVINTVNCCPCNLAVRKRPSRPPIPCTWFSCFGFSQPDWDRSKNSHFSWLQKFHPGERRRVAHCVACVWGISANSCGL